MNFLIIFIILSIINVIFSTYRSIVTIKGGTALASLVSGGYFSFYNIMLIYTVADFPMWQKCVITFFCNVIGVAIVKYLEQRLRKDLLWKVEATIPVDNKDDVCRMLNGVNLSYNYIEGIGNYIIFNIFCPTQADSTAVKQILNKFDARYFVSESKTL